MAILSPKPSEYQDWNMTLDTLPAKCGQKRLDMARNTKKYPYKQRLSRAKLFVDGANQTRGQFSGKTLAKIGPDVLKLF